MSAVAGWVHLPFVKALGWALVHSLWEGALIVLLLASMLPVCRTAKLRYSMACMSLLAMLAVFGTTVAMSIPERQASAWPSWVAATVAHSNMGSDSVGSMAGIITRIQSALPWLVPLWMTGVLLVGLYHVAGWRAAQRMRWVGVCAAPASWQEKLGQLAIQMGVSRPLVLLESSLAEVPVVMGLLRPTLLLPIGLLIGLPVKQLEAILLHELAHVQRLDYLVNLLQTLAENLLFYHPAVWWISGVMRVERENCCDDMVVAAQGDAHGYAAALVMLEERRWLGHEPALAATGGNLMNRIRRLLNQPEQPRVAASLMLPMGLLLSLFCFVAATAQTPSNRQTGEKAGIENLSNPAPGTPYRKWVVEDVAYIIKDEEMAAFNRLQTDEERQEFIRQFWLRRDPTPKTSANEAKEEHYRRIAYSNERFASSIPGWRTDRGRFYIAFGPPDEITTDPDKERWYYRHVEGVGDDIVLEFIGSRDSGELRLVENSAARPPFRR